MTKIIYNSRHITLLLATCLAIGLAIYSIYTMFLGPYVTTDDAYIGAPYISITPQLSGVVHQLHVANNQNVNAGDLLFSIDPDHPLPNSNAVRQAKYVNIYAPIAGKISNLALSVGQHVTAGQAQFALISQDEFWIDANLKETQIAPIKIGQTVRIKIDMYPQMKLLGEVVSISGATGAVFSLLPPQNATGNWVKITQRVPVRIRLQHIDPNRPLIIGTSATVKIKVK